MTDTVVVRNVIVLAAQHPCGRSSGMAYPARIDTRRATLRAVSSLYSPEMSI